MNLPKRLSDITIALREPQGVPNPNKVVWKAFHALVPPDLYTEWKALPRPHSHHFERAMRLYLQLWREEHL